MNKNTENEILKAEHIALTDLFEKLQNETGGQLVEIARYKDNHGDLFVHVAYWEHDTNGFLVYRENWWEQLRISR